MKAGSFSGACRKPGEPEATTFFIYGDQSLYKQYYMEVIVFTRVWPHDRDWEARTECEIEISLCGYAGSRQWNLIRGICCFDPARIPGEENTHK